MIEYTVRPADSLKTICRRFDRPLEIVLGLNAGLRTNPDHIRVGDIIVVPDVGDTNPDVSESTTIIAPPIIDCTPGNLTVPRGQLTFDTEGSDKPGLYFSRTLHVPPGASGVTLGRGYDMKERDAEQIEEDLLRAGLDEEVADILRGASGLTGRQARDFIEGSSLEHFQITHQQQITLFLIAYDTLVKDVRRICDKSDVVRTYGATDWPNLHQHIRDVVVDLRYRGDYHPTSRRRIQASIAKNDLPTFTATMRDRAFWIAVPRDRFERRRDYLKSA